MGYICVCVCGGGGGGGVCVCVYNIYNNNNIYLKSSIQTSSIDYKNYYDMYKLNKYDFTSRSVIITNG